LRQLRVFAIEIGYQSITPFNQAFREKAGVIDALADDFRVVAFDSRGHGKSDKPHGPGRPIRDLVSKAVLPYICRHNPGVRL
jgi:pimeloyl-ACP methyl ester carboxylesterase